MQYEFLEDIAIADVAFKAYGKTLEELFENAAEAVFEIMVDTSKVERKKRWEVELNSPNIDTLLYDFLSDLTALKDEEGAILGKFKVRIEKSNAGYKLKADVYGDNIDPIKYELLTDVKAVTMHMFGVKKTEEGYEATVVLDV